jgi:hypothetical protein
MPIISHGSQLAIVGDGYPIFEAMGCYCLMGRMGTYIAHLQCWQLSMMHMFAFYSFRSEAFKFQSIISIEHKKAIVIPLHI